LQPRIGSIPESVDEKSSERGRRKVSTKAEGGNASGGRAVADEKSSGGVAQPKKKGWFEDGSKKRSELETSRKTCGRE